MPYLYFQEKDISFTKNNSQSKASASQSPLRKIFDVYTGATFKLIKCKRYELGIYINICLKFFEMHCYLIWHILYIFWFHFLIRLESVSYQCKYWPAVKP